MDKQKVEPYGKNEEVDKKRSRHDKVGYDKAQQTLANGKREKDQENDDKAKVAEKEERMGVLLTTIYKEFSTSLEPNADDMEKVLNLMVINDQLTHFKE